MNRRHLMISLVATTLATILPVASALAAVGTPYTQAAFAAAQKQGKRILIDISATWCPTCKAQHPIIRKLAAKSDNSNLVIFSVDFDKQKPVVRAFGANMQSTLIAFRGAKETGRSVGDTDSASIAGLMASNRLSNIKVPQPAAVQAK